MPSESRSHSATAISGCCLSAVLGRQRPGLGPVLGHEGVDDAVLHHHRVVEHGHVGHAAVGVARVDVAAEQRVLLGGRRRLQPAGDEVAVGLDHAAQRARRLELAHHHAHRDARLAALAIGHVGDVLAAAEAALEQVVDQRRRLVVGEVGEQLALEAARQIGAGLRRRDVELGEMLLLLAHTASRAPHCGAMIGEGARASKCGRMRRYATRDAGRVWAQ